MSLALYAAPFNDEIESNKQNNYHLNKKKNEKYKETFQNSSTNSFDSEKVSKFLQHLHKKSTTDEDQDEDNQDEYYSEGNKKEYFQQAPPMPQSAGVERRQLTATQQGTRKQNPFHSSEIPVKKNSSSSFSSSPSSSPAEIEAFTFMGDTPTNLENLNNYQSNYHNPDTAETYYKQHLPEYSALKRRNFNSSSSSSFAIPNLVQEDNIILKKLNYMLELLEDQKDEKTNNVTEEVVLFCFLGIFLIFLIDSFVRVGKYVR